MIFHKVLNYVFSSFSNVAVLRALIHAKTGLSGREISRNAGISAKTALIALTNLENLKIVHRTIGGRDHLFVLNRKNYLVEQGMVPLLQTEAKYLLEIFELIKKHFSKACVSIIVFGSVARKEERIDSDLDICLVLKNSNVNKDIAKLKPAALELAAEKYGASLSIITFTGYQFIRRAQQKLEPVNNIIKEGVFIYGKPLKELLNGKAKL